MYHSSLLQLFVDRAVVNFNQLSTIAETDVSNWYGRHKSFTKAYDEWEIDVPRKETKILRFSGDEPKTDQNDVQFILNKIDHHRPMICSSNRPAQYSYLVRNMFISLKIFLLFGILCCVGIFMFKN